MKTLLNHTVVNRTFCMSQQHTCWLTFLLKYSQFLKPNCRMNHMFANPSYVPPYQLCNLLLFASIQYRKDFYLSRLQPQLNSTLYQTHHVFYALSVSLSPILNSLLTGCFKSLTKIFYKYQSGLNISINLRVVVCWCWTIIA